MRGLTGLAGGVKRRHNLVKWSEDATHSPWTVNGTPTLTAGFADPVGGSAATKFQTPGTGHGVYQSVTDASGPHTFSVWLMGAAGGEVVQIGPGAGSNVTLTTAWVRYSMTVTGTNPVPVIYGGTSGAKTFYAWGAQLVKGSALTPYIKTQATVV